MSNLVSIEEAGVDAFPYAYDDDRSEFGMDGNDGKLHVIPLQDMFSHKLHTGCWCKPTPDDERDELFHHNAFDGRDTATRQ